ncbi:sugar ABC transporter ATP-binding protein [Microbacterium sp. X-17]|uniref:sugar ABC transporter ATP-binding protein n=1 Tax=Microbacterium sp. X-17 TaxID=3144404 RepID=UPI0031F4AFE5
MTDVRKTFGATHALKSVSMRVRAGTVHALVGENGAGKSTALGCLAGRIAPTDGVVEVFGEELKYGDPRASRRAGVVAIYQELTIVPALSAEANVFLGQPIHRAGVLAERAMRRRYLELCDRVGVPPVPPRTPAGSLSVANQQVLEILRALVSDARVILFDEPTAALAAGERQALYELINSLRRSGVTVVFVSHNLDEVLELSDEITIFRDGALRVSAPRAEFTKATLVQEMVGREGDDRMIHEMLEEDELESARDTSDAVRRARLARTAGRPPLLQAAEITVPGAVDGLEVEVRAGETVGIGGLVGSGRSTLLRALAGVEPTSRGRLFIDGREVPWPRSVRQALSYGIALIPEDRKALGLIPAMSAMDNIALSNFRRAAWWGFLSEKSVERATAETAKEFGLQADRLHHAARQLSGGNQQKLLLARWKHRTPRVLLADEPTRGIDVGAKAEILHSLEEMADEGLGLVMVSSELEEVALVADRVFVLAEGLPAGILDRSEQTITTSDILHLAFRSRVAA